MTIVPPRLRGGWTLAAASGRVGFLRVTAKEPHPTSLCSATLPEDGEGKLCIP
jgi:hypothetical protein